MQSLAVTSTRLHWIAPYAVLLTGRVQKDFQPPQLAIPVHGNCVSCCCHKVEAAAVAHSLWEALHAGFGRARASLMALFARSVACFLRSQIGAVSRSTTSCAYDVIHLYREFSCMYVGCPSLSLFEELPLEINLKDTESTGSQIWSNHRTAFMLYIAIAMEDAETWHTGIRLEFSC